MKLVVNNKVTTLSAGDVLNLYRKGQRNFSNLKIKDCFHLTDKPDIETEMSFSNCHFEGRVEFDNFNLRSLKINGCTFLDEINFNNLGASVLEIKHTDLESLFINNCRVHYRAIFDSLQIEKSVKFKDNLFKGNFSLRDTEIKHRLSFTGKNRIYGEALLPNLKCPLITFSKEKKYFIFPSHRLRNKIHSGLHGIIPQ